MDANFRSQTALATDRKTAIKAWLDRIVEKHGPAPTIGKIIRDRGLPISNATIYRILKPDGPTPDTATIDKIAHVFGPPPGVAVPPRQAGFAESDAVEIAASDAPAELTPGVNQGVWRIVSRTANLAGYIPGDLVLFDSTIAPRAGDLVVAQIYDRTGDDAETVIRVYEPPFLVTRTTEQEAPPPILIDSRVSIWGVMTRMARTRRRA